MSADILPPEVDLELYRSRYGDLRGLNNTLLAEHFRTFGCGEGRAASRVSTRSDFVDLVGCAKGSILEIGPFANPMVRGPKVKYFDVLSTQAMRERALEHGLDADRCPSIDYVSPTGDLAVVSEQFDAVASAHVIEHQPDLIGHLICVAKLLQPGGRYYLAVPDKRFCFDYFIAESTIADVVDAHARDLHVHSVASVVEHRAMTTHNDALRHWKGDHGEPLYKLSLAYIRDGLDAYQRNPETYIDCHAWQFTSMSFREIAILLFDLRMCPFKVSRVYDTVYGSNEFYAVLEKA